MRTPFKIHFMRRVRIIRRFLIYGLLISLQQATMLDAEPVKVRNPELELRLETDPSGLPFIAQIVRRDKGELVFAADGPGSEMRDWAEKRGFAADPDTPGSGSAWIVTSDPLFHRAQARWRAGRIEVITHVDLVRQGAMIRTYTELVNHGPSALIGSFPVWSAELKEPETPGLLWWDALSYTPRRARMTHSSQVVLHSKTYSSDTRESPGQVPFWMIAVDGQGLSFGLAWSGGWRAVLTSAPTGFGIHVLLPPDQTQLRLATGESLTRPALEIAAVRGATEAERRRQWLRERQALASHRWDMPSPRYPLIYNHWYSVRFGLSAEFIRNQVTAMVPYGFDAFVVDAGWYAGVGDWTADPRKFKPGEFKAALGQVDARQIQTGLWTCPWLKHVEPGQAAPEIDEPGYHNRFMDAYSIDLAGTDFSAALDRHITDLEQQFGMDWWKYDQEFVGPSSRQGRMRNMMALQNAIETVRRRHPKLTIESCLSGGRMINAFTDTAAQVHWIRDGGGSGYEHGRSNVKEALGAVQFLAPAKVERWTNRLDTVDAGNPELMKWYCRSCMIGVWGISTDLYRITEAQRKVILRELKHYRALNQFKSFLNYEIDYPDENRNLVSIVFYDDRGSSAGILVFRWKTDGVIEESLRLEGLRRDRTFDVVEADGETTKQISGSDLAETGLSILLASEELSRIYFIHAVTHTKGARTERIGTGP